MRSLPRGQGGLGGGSGAAETGDRGIGSTGGRLRAQGLPAKQQKVISCPAFSPCPRPHSSWLPDSVLGVRAQEDAASPGREDARAHDASL